MSVVIKVSKPGYNVDEEADPRNFIFNSDYNHLKTAGSGEFQTTLASTASSVETIAHGLGYKPLSMAYWKEDSEDKWRIASTNPEHSEFSVSTNATVSLYCDDTNVYIEVYNGFASGGNRTFTVQYEFFYEGES